MRIDATYKIRVIVICVHTEKGMLDNLLVKWTLCPADKFPSLSSQFSRWRNCHYHFFFFKDLAFAKVLRSLFAAPLFLNSIPIAIIARRVMLQSLLFSLEKLRWDMNISISTQWAQKVSGKSVMSRGNRKGQLWVVDTHLRYYGELSRSSSSNVRYHWSVIGAGTWRTFRLVKISRSAEYHPLLLARPRAALHQGAAALVQVALESLHSSPLQVLLQFRAEGLYPVQGALRLLAGKRQRVLSSDTH